ncbi:MAG: hypothetical protein QGH74_07270 [Candidatus Brocadiia bacterium]|nr:hypothetical protein [Candidatus Brocadiia bacterium]
MATPKPWEEKWEVKRDLSRGGQGTTFIVVPKDTASGRQCVLKILRNQRSAQARGRMFREVASLRVLHNADCRVPQVLDGNVEEFEVSAVPLYFVME